MKKVVQGFRPQTIDPQQVTEQKNLQLGHVALHLNTKFNKLFIISNCIEFCEESYASAKWSFLIAIKVKAKSQIRI